MFFKKETNNYSFVFFSQFGGVLFSISYVDFFVHASTTLSLVKKLFFNEGKNFVENKRNSNQVQIIVLDEGKVMETGDHSSLVSGGGLYAHLVSRQLSASAAK